MKKLVILGGSGFVGRALCEALAEDPSFVGTRVVVPTRRREKAKHLFTLPTVDVVEASVHDDSALDGLLAGADAVVNLIAILHGSPEAFEAAHVTLPSRLAQACLRAGVHRLVHVSALGVPDDASQPAASHYLASKARGEAALRAAEAQGLRLTVLRPSVIFGEHDQFLNLFARLQAVFPVMPLAGAKAQFQPVWVRDVASALVRCLKDTATEGQTFELAGPEVLTLGELVKLAGRGSGHVRPVLPLPMALGRVQAFVMGLLPGEPLMSGDNLDSMAVPNVATGRWPGLQALGISPASATLLAPGYLKKTGGVAAQLDAWRRNHRS